jgi:hypothetical protein
MPEAGMVEEFLAGAPGSDRTSGRPPPDRRRAVA